MDIIGFIGMNDKTDLLLNIAKILTTMKKSVLIIDSTIEQKTKYVVPAINPTASYITSFEDFDVAVGFNNLEQIKQYFGGQEIQYNIVLISVDSSEKFEAFELNKAKKNFFVTGFDLYTLKRGLEIFNNLDEKINLIKVLFGIEKISEGNEYLNFLATNYKIEWNMSEIMIPIELQNLEAFMDNQRNQKIKFSDFSVQYKDGLIFIVQEILNQSTDSGVRRIVKMIEKGV